VSGAIENVYLIKGLSLGGRELHCQTSKRKRRSGGESAPFGREEERRATGDARGVDPTMLVSKRKERKKGGVFVRKSVFRNRRKNRGIYLEAGVRRKKRGWGGHPCSGGSKNRKITQKTTPKRGGKGEIISRGGKDIHGGRPGEHGQQCEKRGIFTGGGGFVFWGEKRNQKWSLKGQKTVEKRKGGEKQWGSRVRTRLVWENA